MNAGMIGLGKMGANMARRLIHDGHEIIGYNRTENVTREGRSWHMNCGMHEDCIEPILN